jgi:hypothetical protein
MVRQLLDREHMSTNNTPIPPAVAHEQLHKVAGGYACDCAPEPKLGPGWHRRLDDNGRPFYTYYGESSE